MSRETAFADLLADNTPALRAFARTLARDASRADDLTQEALLKAWTNRDRFEAGTNMRAWLFTILRNAFYSEFRKRRREVADADGAYAARLATRPTQDHQLAVADFAQALSKLPPDQREALVLVGAAGLSYEEAAAVMGVATGTAKSRVGRARARLAQMLDVEDGAGMFADARMEAALGEAIVGSAA